MKIDLTGTWFHNIPGVSDYDPEWPVEWCETCGYDVDHCECHDLLHDSPHQDIGTGRPARVFQERRKEPSR